MTNLCQCDKCGKTEEMIPMFTGYRIPWNWRRTDAGDLCEECGKIYQKLIDKFVLKKRD